MKLTFFVAPFSLFTKYDQDGDFSSKNKKLEIYSTAIYRLNVLNLIMKHYNKVVLAEKNIADCVTLVFCLCPIYGIVGINGLIETLVIITYMYVVPV